MMQQGGKQFIVVSDQPGDLCPEAMEVLNWLRKYSFRKAMIKRN